VRSVAGLAALQEFRYQDVNMRRTLLLISCVLFLAGCNMATLAPGGESIKVTEKGADVASCKAVGNIRVPKDKQGNVDIASAQTQFRNQTVGLGGNVGLVTEGFLKVPVAGVAYHCP
jgi:hypothetical protein